MKTRIIIPTYNERENIIPLLTKLLGAAPAGIRILVVDDSSPDGTGDLVRRFVEKEPRVSLMTRPSKMGLGTAYQQAFRRVLDEGGDECILTMDADFSHSPRYIPELIEKCRTNDLVVGSRYMPGGKIENWELWRRLLSWGGNLYVRLITR